jgi:Zn-dependent peptidase ImmA (M78 family)
MLSRRRNIIRAKVEALLNESGIGEPAVPVEAIAARHGIEVLHRSFDEAELSGFLARQPGTRAVIGINSDQPPNRRRFTVAHELGHFFLHGEQGQQEVHVDHTKDFQVKLRGPASSKGVDDEEVEANLFAAELLMPTRFLQRDFSQGFDVSDDDEAVVRLAKRYGVSTQAMSIRLGYLGLISA